MPTIFSRAFPIARVFNGSQPKTRGLNRTIRKLATTILNLGLITCMTPAARADDLISKLNLSITPKFVTSTETDQTNPTTPATGITNTLRLDYGAIYHLDRRNSVTYDNANATFTLGRVYLPTAHGAFPFYVGSVVDRLQTLALRHKLNPALQINAGYFWRSRLCCPGDNDPHATLHAGYGGTFVGAEVNVLPINETGLLLTYSVRALYVPHHPSAELAAAYPDSTLVANRFILPETLTLHVPFPWDHQIRPFVTYTHGANFFNNEPVPEQQNIMNYGFVRTLSHSVTFRAAVVNLRQTHGAATFPGLETAHYSTFDVGLTYATPL